jgi:pyruvate dehydrogenase E1 component alpha subunit
MNTPYIDIYRRLVRLRLVEQKVAEEYGKQQMRCPVHLCVGQEAISVGAAFTLKQNDSLWGTHRSHGPYIASNGNIYAFFAELYGKNDGCCGGRGGSMHLVDEKANFWGSVPIVASTIPIATGAALAFKARKTDRVSMIIFGEGSTEEGVFHESVQYAVLRKLPIVYVCENNGFSVNTPLADRRPPHFSLKAIAQAHGLCVDGGDGNDVFAVYSQCVSAVARARNHQGPSFLEFSTYRWLEHCGPNDDHHLPCRNPSDLAEWKKRCPVSFAEKFLLSHNIATENDLQNIREEELELILQALYAAQEAPFPQPDSAARYVYAEGGKKCVN